MLAFSEVAASCRLWQAYRDHSSTIALMQTALAAIFCATSNDGKEMTKKGLIEMSCTSSPLSAAASLVLLPVFGFCAQGIHAGYAAYFPALFPTHLRATPEGRQRLNALLERLVA